ncbi:MAG: hypothetical protein K8S54_07550 [Spirochaetia bacterium]|nr:hypothetical protein [Spirochaetia bacterium]
MQRSFRAQLDRAIFAGLLGGLVLLQFNCHIERKTQGLLIKGSAPNSQLDNLTRTRENWARFFPLREPVRVYFRSNANLPSTYDSRQKTIGLDPDARADSARHELAHALLDLNRPDSPYWLHEGLAYFLESNACACGSNASIPQWMIERLTSGSIDISQIDLRLWDEADLSTREKALPVAVRSSAFILFVWQRGHLEQFLKAAYRTRELNQVPAMLLWSSDWPEEFRIWLRHGHYRKALSGC